MEHAITYHDIFLSLGEVLSLDRLEIIQQPGRHGQLFLSAVLKSEESDESFYEAAEDVTVVYQQDGTNKILFKGVIVSLEMDRLGNRRHITLEAYDATYALDKKRRKRSFQDLSRTSHSVIDEVMEAYPESICIKNIPEAPIGRIWFQYEETDWEFLKRFVSSYSEQLYADGAYPTARFQAGLSSEEIKVEWEDFPYRMSKNIQNYDYLSQNGTESVMLTQFVEFEIDSYAVYALGSNMSYKNTPWYIGHLKRELKEGLLINTYRLCQEKAMSVPQEYNRMITGVSLDGSTVKIERDKVQVTMQGDLTEEQGTYWFPYSTVAASADGSGWYSMPEIGDNIRVYFPTNDEKEGYVITKHGSHLPD